MRKIPFSLLYLLALPWLAHAFDGQELLEADKAFALTDSRVDGKLIVLEWTVADGYYLYRSRFRLRSRTDSITLDEPELPPGIIKNDKFFGEVETYRGTVEIPVGFTGSIGGELIIEARSQGCADIGVCYPPHTQTTFVALAEEPAVAEPEPAGPSPLQATGNLATVQGLSGSDGFLSADEAFIFSAEVRDGRTLSLDWQIAEDHYMYKDKFALSIEDADDVSIGTISWPTGKQKNDKYFGLMEVYYTGTQVDVPLVRSDTGPRDIVLKARYQGCAEAGVCYPPVHKWTTLSLPGISAAEAAQPAPPTTEQPATDMAPSIVASVTGTVEQGRITRLLAGGNLIQILPAMFLAGLLLAFTACVYPMIPILSSLIVGQGEQVSTGRGFWLSLVYVEAVALTYAAIGVMSGMLGAGVQAWFQHPVVLTVFALVFVGLALSMFGFFTIQMPAALQSKLTEISGRQRGGTMVGVFVMGALSALIIGPCAGPVLFGAMAFIAERGNYMLGGLSLFALGNGLGTPLLIVGASGGKLLPKAGSWMDTVKTVFGVVMLGIAVVLLERFLPAWISMMLWALLLIIPAIYMGALEPIPVEVTGWHKLWKGTGIAMLLYGLIIMIGAATGGNDVSRPLAKLSAGVGSHGSKTAKHLAFKRIKTVQDFKNELADAQQTGQFVMLDFYADWCTYCIKMENYTFPDPQVQATLANVRLIQADVTRNDIQDIELLNHFNLFAPPTILFFGPDGQERKSLRLVGFKNAANFNSHALAALASTCETATC